MPQLLQGDKLRFTSSRKIVEITALHKDRATFRIENEDGFSLEFDLDMEVVLEGIEAGEIELVAP